MIEFFSNWAGQLVVALVIGSLLEMLVPNGKNKKYVKMLIGIYIIFCIVSPLTNAKEVFSEDSIEDSIEEYLKKNTSKSEEKSTDEKIEDLYIKEIENSITEDLANMGYEVVKCKIETELSSKVNNSRIKSIEIKVKKYIKQGVVSEVEKIENVDISINKSEKENTTNIESGDIEVIKNLISEKYEIEESKIHISS